MSYLYLIAESKNGPVKVGISADPESRLRQLQSGSSRKLSLIHAFEMPDREIARALESCFHGTKKEKRLSGEWFDLDPAHALEVMCLHIIFSLSAFAAELSEEEREAAREMCGVNAAMKKLRGEDNGKNPHH